MADKKTDAVVSVPAVNADQDKADRASRLAFLQEFISRSRLGRLAGVQFGGQRDIYGVAGYPAQGKVLFEHYWGLYTRGDIAGKIVDMPAKTTWKKPPSVVEEGMDPAEGTDFTNAFDKMAKRLKLWSYMQRLDRLAGIGQYAVMLIGVRGGDDQTLKTPLKRVAKPEDIIYLSVYNERHAEIQSWVQDPGNERFGLPEVYKLKTTSETSTFNVKGQELIVHASRVIHAAEDVLEDDTFGRPRLERCLNRLFDLEKVAASTGEAYWQQVASILQAMVDKDMEISDKELDDLDQRLGDMVHDLRRQFTGKGIQLSYLSPNTPNVSQVGDFYFSLIAGSANIPKRILFGSELGELASSQDQSNYYGTINERQESFAEPHILRAFIDRMILIGALPTPKEDDGEYQINWPPLYEESDDDVASTNLKKAQVASTLTPVGGNPRELVKITAEGIVELVEREADEPMDLTLPQDVTDPNAVDPATGLPLDPSQQDPSAQDPAAGGTNGTDPAAGSGDPSGQAPGSGGQIKVSGNADRFTDWEFDESAPTVTVHNFDKNHDPHSGEFGTGDGDGKSNEEDKSSDGGGDSASVDDATASMDELDAAYDGVKLTPAQQTALQAYTSNGYLSINSALRDGRGLTVSGDRVKQNLDATINKRGVPTDVVVYRGAGNHVVGKVGQTFTDKGYVSTSANPDIATFFSTEKTMYKITVPKGTKAAWVPKVQDSFNAGDEAELLLGRGHRFKVTNIKKGGLKLNRKKYDVVEVQLVA